MRLRGRLIYVSVALAAALALKPPLAEKTFEPDVGGGAMRAAKDLATAPVPAASVSKPSVADEVEQPVKQPEKKYTKKQYKLNKQLVKAAAKGDVSKVEKLLGEGADIEFNDDTSFFMYAFCWTPLQYASRYGNLEVMDFLISHGASLGPNVRVGSTPLMVAAYHNQAEAMELLLAKGAEVDGRSDNDFTALMSASINGCLEAGRKLLEHGADVNAQSSLYGDTPIYLAVERDNHEFAGFLLSHLADMNVRNIFGITPLIKAAGNGSVNSVRLLVARGADVAAQDDEGMNALMWAVRAAYPRVEELPPEELEKMGVAERATYEMKRRYRKESIEIIEALLASPHLDINAADNSGKTALDHSDDGEVRELLKKHGAK